MKSKILLLSVLLAMASTSQAQSNLVLYDADSFRIGTVFSRDVSSSVTVYTSDGLLLKLDLRNGRSLSGTTEVFYANAECTGQAYVPFASAPWGYLLHIRDHPGEVARVEWGAAEVKNIDVFNNAECWTSDICGQPASDCSAPAGSGASLFIEASIVDDSQYGFKEIPDGANSYRGFTPPLNAKVVKSDIVYCNSFENCPAQQ